MKRKTIKINELATFSNRERIPTDMPIIPKKSPKVIQTGRTDVTEQPDKLRPFTALGVSLTPRGTHAVGTCPFCGKDGKFSVAIASGLWRCLVCGTGTDNGGGNALTFVRLLWQRSQDATTDATLAELASERGYLSYSSLKAWGVCQSIVDGRWLIPGYSIDGELDQLYRRTRMIEKGQWVWRQIPLPGLWPEGRSHALHAPLQVGRYRLNADRQTVYVFEGPWDSIAFWEVARTCKRSTSGDLEITGSETTSLLEGATVMAFPGCGTFRDDWLPLFRGKDVIFPFDSDHPRIEHGKTFRAGMDGVYRAAKKLSGIARSVQWVRWGVDGYDPERPSGWDVRDHLRSMDGRHATRYPALQDLLSKVEPVPDDWFTATQQINGHAHTQEIEPQHCQSWATLEAAWMDAQEWRSVMSDALAVLLAVAASTLQAGNQLFFQLVGDAGSGKTTICDGLLVSKNCHHLEHLTGFHSGWRKPNEDGTNKDCSLIARINGKTLITPEADVLMSSPRFTEIMSQQRRIFDGKSGATYKNSDEDTLYVGLRTPWIMAGTPALLDTDQSRLGDRFLRIIIDQPSEAMKRAILRKALKTELIAVLETSNGTAASTIDPKLRKAQAMTGGYVDWLRACAADALTMIDIDERAEDRCIDLAELTADLRARPNTDTRKQEVHDSKELPTRVARQLARLAMCLAVVTNKKTVDAAVMKIVRKVAFDTAHGMSLNIVKWFQCHCPKTSKRYQDIGVMPGLLTQWTGWTEERLASYMMFLRKINVVVHVPQKHSKGYWRLTDRVDALYTNVMKD